MLHVEQFAAKCSTWNMRACGICSTWSNWFEVVAWWGNGISAGLSLAARVRPKVGGEGARGVAGPAWLGHTNYKSQRARREGENTGWNAESRSPLGMTNKKAKANPKSGVKLPDMGHPIECRVWAEHTNMGAPAWWTHGPARNQEKGDGRSHRPGGCGSAVRRRYGRRAGPGGAGRCCSRSRQ
jgi:hypothetical protein